MAIRNIFGGKKKKLGFAEKQRTREEIAQEYSHHAFMHGRASHVIKQNQEVLEQHMAAMIRLDVERLKAPPPQPKEEPPIEPEGPKSA